MEKTISIEWHIDDVKCQAKSSFDINMSDDDAMSVLQSVDHNHDANIGVNWDVLDVHIQPFVSNYQSATTQQGE